MRDYESGFLALILMGVLVIVIGLGLMIPLERAPASPRDSLARPLEATILHRETPAVTRPMRE